MEQTSIETGQATGINISLGKPHKVILYNDENHEMTEVVNQIVKATGYGSQQATAIMLEAHNSGRAIVWSGGLERCEHISAILEEIRLGTRIEPA
jgi:ATP-dependent Clp protease adaptor protein ClpS